MARRMIRGLTLACSLLPVGGHIATAQSTSQFTDFAGPYLAARSAGALNDFGAASQWLREALAHDPTNPALIDNYLLSLISLADLTRAAPIANQAVTEQVESQLAQMVVLADTARAGDWNDLIDILDAGHGIGVRIDMIARAWAQVGLGDDETALATFDAVSTLPGSQGFGTYHRAMALAYMRRLPEAAAMLALPPGQGVPRTRRTVIAHIQILTELGQNDDALAILDASFARSIDPSIIALRAAVASGGVVPFDVIQSPTDGIAEAFFTEGGAYTESSPPAIVLLYAQIAHALNNDDADLIMMSAGLLEELDRFEQAAATFAKVRPDDPGFHSAEFGRANVLRQAGEYELAIEVLQSLLRGHPDLALAHSELGDILRVQSRFIEADTAYSTAIDLFPASDGRLWGLHYKRGITRHQLDDWTAAETDFRTALAQNPNHAGLLNYLGYSLIERGEKLDEAFTLINRAISVDPENGAIVDSLGWALFSLGRHQEAVVPMERAAALLPEDPVILDHLGDVYFAVGRTLEAQFQWSRALSYSDDEDMNVLLRDKMDNGIELPLQGVDDSDLSVAQDL